MLKNEQLESIQNIYYIKDRGEYYVKIMFSDGEEKNVSLKEARLIIEKINNTPLLQKLQRRILKQPGFCKFYKLVEGEYREITLEEYQVVEEKSKPEKEQVTKEKSKVEKKVEKKQVNLTSETQSRKNTIKSIIEETENLSVQSRFNYFNNVAATILERGNNHPKDLIPVELNGNTYMINQGDKELFQVCFQEVQKAKEIISGENKDKKAKKLKKNKQEIKIKNLNVRVKNILHLTKVKLLKTTGIAAAIGIVTAVSSAIYKNYQDLKSTSSKQEMAADYQVDSLPNISKYIDTELIAAQLEEEYQKAEQQRKKRAEVTKAHNTILKTETIIVEPPKEVLIEGQSIEKLATPDFNLKVEETGLINYIVAFQLTPEMIDKAKAIIQHEAGFDPTEVYAVASTVINRCISGRWGGSDPYSVLTAPQQFTSYLDGYYYQYINGNYADYTSEIVDQLFSGQLAPMHNYESFSSGGSGEQFTSGGNHYR